MLHDLTGTGEILYDYRSDKDKEVTWKKHRLITLRLAQAYKRIKSDKYHRIISCASYMEFRRYEDSSMKLHTANFCQTRLCPTCNWRRSMKIFAQVNRIMSNIEKDYSFTFLTLTCKNVDGRSLNKQIDKLIAAFKALCLRKQFKTAVRGWCRAFEVTYNWSSEEYHPHFHVILAVDKDYFTSARYITQDEFCVMWQSCLDVDYKPIVHVKKFTESEKGKGKEVAEVAKYTIKASNVMANLQPVSTYSQDIQAEVKRVTDKITDEIVFVLDAALRNRRLMGYGGIFKTVRQKLKLDDDIDSDLIRTADKGGDMATVDLPFEIERYRWNIGLRNYARIYDEG